MIPPYGGVWKNIRYRTVMASFTADDWIDAAYRRFNDAGLSAVRVEAIARDLGATKGSFYWHFADRRALVDAVMARWEQTETDRVIELVERADDPEERLRVLYDAIVERMVERGGERTLYVDGRREGVDEVVARVTERRVAFVAALVEDAGFDAAEARRRGASAVASVIGFQQLAAGGVSLRTTELVERAGRRMLRIAVRRKEGDVSFGVSANGREDLFNPVDGLAFPVSLNAVVFDRSGFNYTFLGGFASWKFARDDAGYSLGVERPLLSNTRLFLGGETHDLTATLLHMTLSPDRPR